MSTVSSATMNDVYRGYSVLPDRFHDSTSLYYDCISNRPQFTFRQSSHHSTLRCIVRFSGGKWSLCIGFDDSFDVRQMRIYITRRRPTQLSQNCWNCSVGFELVFTLKGNAMPDLSRVSKQTCKWNLFLQDQCLRHLRRLRAQKSEVSYKHDHSSHCTHDYWSRVTLGMLRIVRLVKNFPTFFF